MKESKMEINNAIPAPEKKEADMQEINMDIFVLNPNYTESGPAHKPQRVYFSNEEEWRITPEGIIENTIEYKKIKESYGERSEPIFHKRNIGFTAEKDGIKIEIQGTKLTGSYDKNKFIFSRGFDQGDYEYGKFIKRS